MEGSREVARRSLILHFQLKEEERIEATEYSFNTGFYDSRTMAQLIIDWARGKTAIASSMTAWLVLMYGVVPCLLLAFSAAIARGLNSSWYPAQSPLIGWTIIGRAIAFGTPTLIGVLLRLRDRRARNKKWQSSSSTGTGRNEKRFGAFP